MTTFIDRLATKYAVDPGTKVVLLLAYHREDLTPDVLAEAVAFLYGPDAVRGIEDVAESLDWAERLGSGGWEREVDVLRALLGTTIRLTNTDAMCRQLAEERETDAVRAAQQVASLIVRQAVA